MNSYKQTLYIGIIRITANLIMLGAVFLAMHQSFRWHAWPSEAVFCLCFFGITIPAWIGAIYLTRWVRRTFPANARCFVDLPGRGRQLVEWRVAESAQAFPQILR